MAKIKLENKYKKSDTIKDLRSKYSNKQAVLNSLYELYNSKRPWQPDDLAKKALDDLFDETSSAEPKNKFVLREHTVEEISRLEKSNFPRYLRYRYAYEVFPIDLIVNSYPPAIQIEPTSVCNYRCIFCYQTDPRLSKKSNGHMGNMKFELFKNLIDQIEGHVEAVTLASRGEPTLNKNLPKMLNYMGDKFLAAKINTNASLLNETLAHNILDSGLQTVVFSADAASEPLYSKLRVHGDFDKVFTNISKFCEIKEKYYPHSKLITRVSGVSVSEEQNLDEMEDLWGGLLDQVVFVQYNPWENVYDSDLSDITQPCSDLWRRFFIWWDGRTAPCDVDYLTTLSTETVFEKTISEIWNGRSYEVLRDKHLSAQRQSVEPCRRCTVV